MVAGNIRAIVTEWRERALSGAATALKERERDDRDDEIARLKSKVARSPWTTSCSTPRSPRWRASALWRTGGRDDEPDRLALCCSLLWSGAGSARVECLARQCLSCSQRDAAEHATASPWSGRSMFGPGPRR